MGNLSPVEYLTGNLQSIHKIKKFVYEIAKPRFGPVFSQYQDKNCRRSRDLFRIRFFIT